MNKLLITSFLLAAYASLQGMGPDPNVYNVDARGKISQSNTTYEMKKRVFLQAGDDIALTNINARTGPSIIICTKKSYTGINTHFTTLTTDIIAQNIKIKKSSFSGDLLVIFPEKGTCILDSVTIKGDLKIRGAGKKITIKGASQIDGDIQFLEKPGKVDASSHLTLGGSIFNGKMIKYKQVKTTKKPGSTNFISKKMLFGTALSIGVLMYFLLKKNRAKKTDPKEANS